MMVVLDAYFRTWKHSLHVTSFLFFLSDKKKRNEVTCNRRLLHELAIFRWEAKKRQIPLIAPSRGSNLVLLVAMFTCAMTCYCIVSYRRPLPPSILWEDHATYPVIGGKKMAERYEPGLCSDYP